jgi:hypothetical protein
MCKQEVSIIAQARYTDCNSQGLELSDLAGQDSHKRKERKRKKGEKKHTPWLLRTSDENVHFKDNLNLADFSVLYFRLSVPTVLETYGMVFNKKEKLTGYSAK